MIVASISSIIVMNYDIFSEPEYRQMRGILFMSMGLAVVIPVIHLLIAHGVKDSFKKLYIGHLILIGAIYICGAVFYTTRFPEQLYPGRFDLIGSSHNLLHICVILATAILIYLIERMRWEKLYSHMHSRRGFVAALKNTISAGISQVGIPGLTSNTNSTGNHLHDLEHDIEHADSMITTASNTHTAVSIVTVEESLLKTEQAEAQKSSVTGLTCSSKLMVTQNGYGKLAGSKVVKPRVLAIDLRRENGCAMTLSEDTSMMSTP